MIPRPVLAAVARHRRRLLFGTTGSEAFSTFVSADYTPTADGVTETALTFTLKNGNDEAISGASVTYA